MNIFKCCDNPQCFFNGGNMESFVALHNLQQQYNRDLMQKMFSTAEQHMRGQQEAWAQATQNSGVMAMPHNFSATQNNWAKGEDMLRSLWENAANFAQSYMQLTQDLAHKYMQWYEHHTCGRFSAKMHSGTCSEKNKDIDNSHQHRGGCCGSGAHHK